MAKQKNTVDMFQDICSSRVAVSDARTSHDTEFRIWVVVADMM